jgi:hypothetical protein
MGYISLSDGAPTEAPDKLQKPDVALGEAFSSWQLVENFLAVIFLAATRPENKKAGLAAFHEVVGFRVRSEMVTAALKQTISKECDKDDWDDVARFVGRKSGRRNVLAHSIVVFDHKVKDPKRQVFLIDGLFDPAKNPMGLDAVRDMPRIHEKELLEMAASFESAHGRLVGFWAKHFAG